MNKRFLITFIGVIGYCLSGAVLAQMFDFNFSDDSAQVRYSSNVESESAYGRSEWGFGALYQTDDNTMLDAWFQISDEAGSKTPGLDAGVGPKLFGGSTKTQEYVALALGGMLQYRPPQTNRMLLIASGSYAPNIVTFLDADHMWEANFRIGYEILPSAIAYIGYRAVHVEFDVRKGEGDIDKGANFGLQMNF